MEPAVFDNLSPDERQRHIELVKRQVEHALRPLLSSLALRDIYEKRIDSFFNRLRTEFGLCNHEVRVSVLLGVGTLHPMSCSDAAMYAAAYVEGVLREQLSKALPRQNEIASISLRSVYGNPDLEDD